MFLKISKRIRVFGLYILSSGLISCSGLTHSEVAFPFGEKPITPISQLSTQTVGTEIYLKGVVKEQAPFVDSGAYQIQDSTGVVWIRTNQPLPQKGEEIVVKGVVAYQTIPIGDQELGELYVVQSVLNNPQTESSSPAPKNPKPVDSYLLPHKQQNN